MGVNTERRKIEAFPQYEISTDGVVWGPGREKSSVLKPVKGCISASGYLTVNLSCGLFNKKAYVHRLVLSTFLGLPKQGQEARHLDGNKLNNRLENLAWGTKQENEADKLKHGTRLQGETMVNAKLSDALVRKIFALRQTGLSHKAIGEVVGVHAMTVSRVLHRKIWKHVVIENRHVACCSCSPTNKRVCLLTWTTGPIDSRTHQSGREIEECAKLCPLADPLTVLSA